MIEENHKFLSQKERKVVPEHLGIKILRGGAKKDLMAKKQVLVIEINPNYLRDSLILQVFEEFIQIFRVPDLSLNRKLDRSLNNLKLFEISFTLFIFMFFFCHMVSLLILDLLIRSVQ